MSPLLFSDVNRGGTSPLFPLFCRDYILFSMLFLAGRPKSQRGPQIGNNERVSAPGC